MAARNKVVEDVEHMFVCQGGFSLRDGPAVTKRMHSCGMFQGHNISLSEATGFFDQL
jgi:hypothetical protein